LGASLVVIGIAFPVASANAEGDTSECLMLLGKDGNYMLCGKTLTKLPSTLKGKSAHAAGVPRGAGYGRATGGGHSFEMAHRSVTHYTQEMGHGLEMHRRSEARYDREMNYGPEIHHRSETGYGQEMSHGPEMYRRAEGSSQEAGHVPEMHYGSETGSGQGMGVGQETGHGDHHRH